MLSHACRHPGWIANAFHSGQIERSGQTLQPLTNAEFELRFKFAQFCLFVCFLVKNHVCDGLGALGRIFVWDTKEKAEHRNTWSSVMGPCCLFAPHSNLVCPCQTPTWWSMSVSCLFQPREKGRMRFHKLQNVQIALDFLKHRQVAKNHMTHNIKTIFVVICFHHQWVIIILINDSSVGTHIRSLLGQTGQYQERWHSRWKPQADPGADMDHHPPLPGNEGHF